MEQRCEIKQSIPLNLLLTPLYGVADSATKCLLFLSIKTFLSLSNFCFNLKHKWKVSMILLKKEAIIYYTEPFELHIKRLTYI